MLKSVVYFTLFKKQCNYQKSNIKIDLKTHLFHHQKEKSKSWNNFLNVLIYTQKSFASFDQESATKFCMRMCENIHIMTVW